MDDEGKQGNPTSVGFLDNYLAWKSAKQLFSFLFFFHLFGLARVKPLRAHNLAKPIMTLLALNIYLIYLFLLI